MKTVLYRFIFTILVTFGVLVVFGQDEEIETLKKDKGADKESDEIKTLSKNNHNGGFFGITFKTSRFNQEPMVSLGFRTGWIIGRTLGVGFEAHGFVPTAKFDNIYMGNEVIAIGGYGGMFLEPILFSNQIVHITFPVAAGSGWFGYHEDWEGNPEPAQLLDEDLYWYLEPGVSVELNISKNFRLAVGASERFTEELELPNTPSSAFNGRNYFFTLKFGKF